MLLANKIQTPGNYPEESVQQVYFSLTYIMALCVCDVSQNLVVLFASDVTPGLSRLKNGREDGKGSLVCDVILDYHN